MKIKLTILFLILAIGANAQAWWFAVPQEAETLPIALWRLDETSGTNVADAIGSNDGTNNGATINQPSVSKAYDFNGSTDDISFVDALIPATGDFTINIWMNSSNTGATNNLLSQYGAGQAGRMAIEANLTNDYFRLFIDHTTDINILGTTPILDGDWHMCTATRSGDDFEIFVDGVSEGTQTQSGISVYQGANMRLAELTGVGQNLDGKLDQVSLFLEEITAGDITELYKDGAGVYYDNWTTGLQSKAISVWELDETSGTSVLDHVIENDGTNNGATIDIDGVVSDLLKSYDFDGTNDRIAVADDNSLDLTEMTISVWIYPHTYGSVLGSDRYGRIVRKGGNYDFMTINDPDGALNTLAAGALRGTDNAISLNTWHYVVLTDNGTTAKIYIDGAEDASGSSVIGSTNTDDLVIGNYNDGTAIARFFDGKIDQVRVYNVAITSDDVTDLYNLGRGK